MDSRALGLGYTIQQSDKGCKGTAIQAPTTEEGWGRGWYLMGLSKGPFQDI